VDCCNGVFVESWVCEAASKKVKRRDKTEREKIILLKKAFLPSEWVANLIYFKPQNTVHSQVKCGVVPHFPKYLQVCLMLRTTLGGLLDS